MTALAAALDGLQACILHGDRTIFARVRGADAGHRLRIGFAPLSSSTRGWIYGPGGEGFVKLVEDADSGVLVGATSAGPSGGEVLSALTVAVHARVTTAQLRRMIWAYPTFHRVLDTALADLET